MYINKERGVALLGTVFLITVILLIMSLAIIFTSNTNIKQSAILVNDNKSLYFTDSGVAQSIAQLRQNPGNFDPIVGSTNTYNVAVDTNAPCSSYNGISRTFVFKDPDITADFLRLTDENRGLKTDGIYSVVLTTSTAFENTVFVKSVGVYRDTLKEILAEITIESPGEYFGASNKELKIAYGADLTGSKIYGDSLVFQPGDPDGVHTKIGEASYYTVTEGYNAAYIDGTSPTQTNIRPVLPVLNAGKMDNYENLAGDSVWDGGGLMSGGHTLSGNIGVTTDGNVVYYCDGNLTINGTITGNIIVVADGDITINGNITYAVDSDGNPIASLGLISKKDVIFNSSFLGEPPLSSSTMTINGLIIAPNGRIRASGMPSAKKNLVLNGGFLVDNGMSVADVFKGNRKYSPDNTLKGKLPYLPFLVYQTRWVQKEYSKNLALRTAEEISNEMSRIISQ